MPSANFVSFSGGFASLIGVLRLAQIPFSSGVSLAGGDSCTQSSRFAHLLCSLIAAPEQLRSYLSGAFVRTGGPGSTCSGPSHSCCALSSPSAMPSIALAMGFAVQGSIAAKSGVALSVRHAERAMDAFLHDVVHGAFFSFRATSSKNPRNTECSNSETGAADILESASPQSQTGDPHWCCKGTS